MVGPHGAGQSAAGAAGAAGPSAGPSAGAETPDVGRTSMTARRAPYEATESYRRTGIGSCGVGSARTGAADPRPARRPASQRARVVIGHSREAGGTVLAVLIGPPAAPTLPILPALREARPRPAPGIRFIPGSWPVLHFEAVRLP